MCCGCSSIVEHLPGFHRITGLCLNPMCVCVHVYDSEDNVGCYPQAPSWLVGQQVLKIICLSPSPGSEITGTTNPDFLITGSGAQVPLLSRQAHYQLLTFTTQCTNMANLQISNWGSAHRQSLSSELVAKQTQPEQDAVRVQPSVGVWDTNHRTT